MTYAAGMLNRLMIVMALGAALAPETPLASYHDAALNLTYSYPAEFHAQPGFAETLERGLKSGASDPEHAAMAKCISVPLAVVKGDKPAESAASFGILLMVRVDHACGGEPDTADDLGVIAQRTTAILGVFGGRPVTENAIPYKLDGRAAAFVQGSAPAKALGEGKMVHSGTACTLVGKNTVCWLMVDSHYKAMPGLVMEPVSFGSGAAVPLVPREILQAW